MRTLDFVVVAVYLIGVLCLGFWTKLRQKNAEDYYLGGRRMPWWAVGISIIATAYSSASLIGGTGEGFNRGLLWMQLQLGDLAAFIVVSLVFLPFFSNLRLTTAYEYLERRFGIVARTFASFIFILQSLIRAGLVIYAPALALSTLMNWPIESAILVSAALAIIYSYFGGLAADVWTDVIQLGVIVLGIGLSLAVIGMEIPGGLGEVFRNALNQGKLQMLRFSADPRPGLQLWWSLFAYGTLALAVSGTNQQTIQRYLACEDLRSARRALFLGWGVGAVTVLSTLLLGIAISAWADAASSSLPPDLKPDQMFVAFVQHRLPAGLAGLMVATIFAAAMSSIDSAVHSVSTATMVDFIQRFRKIKLSDTQELRWARVLTAVYGVAAVFVALQAAKSGTTLLDMMVTWLGYFSGPLLGLFLLGLLSRRANETGAIAGVIAAFAAVAVLVIAKAPAKAGFHPLWMTPIAVLITTAVGGAASRLKPSPDGQKISNLVFRHNG